jgi:hypothetical protein
MSLRALQTPKPVEYEVKAAFLYNFSKFVRWPAASLQGRDNFAICILGMDPFGAVLDSILAGESVDGRTVHARRISEAREAVACQILFISVSEEKRLKEILVALGKSSTLTVSELSQFVDRGGMIQFLVEDNKVRFRVNLAPAQQAGLMLSSDLLRVAAGIKRGD